MTATALVARPMAPRRQSDLRQAQRATSQLRLMVMMLVYAGAVLLVVGKLALLAAHAQGDNVGAIGGAGPRRDIVDRNGAPLARTIDTWAIGVHPARLLGNRGEIADRLAAILGLDRGQLYAALTSGRPFTYIARNISASLVTDVNAIGEPAIVFERHRDRLYPQSQLAAHVLGFLDPKGATGVSGMERVLDGQLSAAGDAPIALSIDTRVQAAMESELGQAMTSFKARSAAGIVLDVATGEVVAMVSFPVFNPNKVGAATLDELRNNTTQSVYELGSAFKPITMATAIDTGVVTSMARRFDATAPMKVGRFTIKDDHPQRRFLDIPETLVHSSNIATARIAKEVGKDRLAAMFVAMGFRDRPAIELKERGRPLWPGYWGDITTMTTAYGHGIAVTPLHLASAYAALVNGGILRPATLLKVAPGKAAAGRRVISQATSDRMRQLLRLVVLKGTGRKSDVAGYRVGGKTGTAEVAVAGGYSKKANVSTFAAAFPMDAPRYVVVAMLDSPIGNAQSAGQATAGWTAAPVVGRFIARAGPLLGVIPDTSRDIDVADLLPLLWGESGRSTGEPE
ncbi:peptidoglycan D,D-transpeptidase FtsI family protein [uncultured Sphingomonas sp.]|uniref:peptidoglycan D,D-transpeptidase FtsI family protein n=1 Tax=uncultured Sphingomonas sp. TaxID=158754 RepID=UPI0035CC0A9D